MSRGDAKLLAHHRSLAAGGGIAIVGLALVGTHQSEPGAIITLAGLLYLFYSIHRYGRLGAAGDDA